jgi:hypothetical protein
MAAGAQILQFPADARQRAPQDDDGPKRSVKTLRKQFTDAVGAKSDENTESADAERYFHSVQWTKEELKILEDRRQPPITFNRVKRKIHTIMGILEKMRQDPIAFPRTPNKQADDGAELATKVVNFALGWDWGDMSTAVGKRCAMRGIAGAELVVVQGDQGDPDIEWDEVDQRDFFYDPRSTKPDFSDARYMGTTRWMDADEAIETWPDYEEELNSYVDHGPITDWERGDERKTLAWLKPKEKELRIVDHWFMVGSQWHYVIYCGNTALEWGESPHRNEKKKSVSKFEMMSYEVDQDGDRYAIFRDLKSPQDEINHRRSKALHQLNSRKVIADDGAVDDVELARREYARADGWVVKNKGYEITTEDAQAQAVVKGNLELLQEAKAEIDTFGPNPGLIGTEIPAESGRAIQLLQAAGIAELGTFSKSFKNWKIRVYRKTWNACQQFWQAPRFIRVSDDPKLQQFIQINGWEQDEAGFPVVINQLSALDVDIIIDEGPDAITSMADTFDLLMALAKSGIKIPPEAIVQMSALPASMKEQVLQKMQPTQMDQQAIMLQMQQAVKQIELLASQATLNLAKAGQAQVEGQATMIEAQKPPEGPAAQIDTPADLAKANLDAAKAREIDHKIQVGTHVPQQEVPEPPPPPPPAPPGLFELNMAKARREDALAGTAYAQAAAQDASRIKTLLEAKTIEEAPPGMLTKPPPRPAGGGAS